MRLSLAVRSLLCLSVVLLASCAGTPMRVPATALAGPSLPVVGHRQGSKIEHDFSIGDSAVHGIGRSSQPAKFANRTITANGELTELYHFELTAAGRSLHGECTDLSVPRGQQVVGFGKFTRNLACVCREAEAAVVQLSLVDGKGTLELSGQSFQVKPIRQDEAGKTGSDTLGYALSSERGIGALERTGRGRAWPVPGLDARAAQALSCAYAALLLYRH